MLPSVRPRSLSKPHVLLLLVVATALAASVFLLGRRATVRQTPVDQPTAPPATEHGPAPALPFEDGPHWVDLYEPGRACNGYTLILYQRRHPMLIDMNGNVVHHWDHVRGRGRARLTEKGNLLLICADNVMRELTWDGKVVWQFAGIDTGDLAHHDIVRLTNGNTLIIYDDEETGEDYLLEVSTEGRPVWEWRTGDHLSEHFGPPGSGFRENTHVNSVQELPPNRMYQEGDKRFRPGNILVSARNLNAIFIVERTRGEVVWWYDRELDLQHEAHMIAPGCPGAGHILVFNNGGKSRYHYRRSSIMEIEPASGTVLWEYASDGFFSSTGGVQQNLPNGNILVVSSTGGRAFEIEPDGSVVWQWIPPYNPMRPIRYPYDHCPQLAVLPQPDELVVMSADGGAYVDRELRTFELRWATIPRRIHGRGGRVLFGRAGCRKLLLPQDGVLELAFGIDTAAVGERRRGDFAACFRATLSSADSEQIVELEQVVRRGDTHTWRRRSLHVGRFAGQTVSLCLDVEPFEHDNEELVRAAAVWENPTVTSRHERQGRLIGSTPRGTATERERRVGAEHLRALGYVD